MALTAESFSIALSHHQAGRLVEAEQLYRQILAADPSHAGAWNFLGLIALQLKRHEVAAQCIEQSVRLNPSYSEASTTLAERFRNSEE